MTVYLVTGATGRLGGAAITFLRERVHATEIRALVRTDHAASGFARRGISAAVGDYADRASLDAAFLGVDRLIFVSSPELDPVVRATEHRTVLDSAVRAGIGHVVYTSAFGARNDPGHAATEDSLGESGVSHTILRNALYTDAFVDLALTQARRDGVITSASGGQHLTTASIADLAEAAASSVISIPEKSVWELRGPRWSFDDLAAALSAALERPIAHAEVDDESTGPFGILYPLVRRGAFDVPSEDLAVLLGRPAAGVADVVRREL